MLKRLELIGFKSFAEKTQFDFGPGITAIVGPNGSGKSNLVDAVRWILGEQSAKSLRGGEMTDVIFNGSTSRRSLGMAEVSLLLDNTRRMLAIDADEVQITRRVYRSGEGEYLINRQPARLKDIKEMFLGSGAGAHAYSIIEQGRVDVLLQASTRERRAIFEEAAGISRFKAKKLETLRKLERVEQNLQRLRDIIEEVDRQVRSVKLQAAKAERYREYTGRLKELRVTLSLDEYHRFARQAEQTAAALASLRETLAGQSAQAAQRDAEVRRLEEALAAAESSARSAESALHAARQRIAAEETTLQHEQALAATLEQDLAQTRAQLHALDRQLTVLAAAVAQSAGELAGVDADCARQRSAAAKLEAELAQAVARLAQLRAQLEADNAELMEQMRQAARRHNEQVSFQAQADSLAQHRHRLHQKTAQASQSLSQLGGEMAALEQAEARVQDQLAAARRKADELKQQQEQTQDTLDQTRQELAAAREQHSGLTSRIHVLEGLEQSYEGLSAGVREVLALVRGPDPGPWGTVVGLVADLLTVPREYAPLVDLALGGRAQSLLVRDPARLASALARRERPFSGRVSFLPLPEPGSASLRANRLLETSPAGRVRLPTTADGLPAHPGLVASAAKLVSCEHADLAHLPDYLLGTTLVVKDLATARAIAELTSGYRFVTLGGELLEADGTLTVGEHHAETGLLSRKSELRELRGQAAALERQIAATEDRLAALRDQLDQLSARAHEVQLQLQVLTEQSADLRTRLTQQRQRHEGLEQELRLNEVELQQLDRELESLREACRAAEADARAADARVQELQARQAVAEAEIRTLEHQRQHGQQAWTAAKVALAAAEERRTALAARHEQARQDWQQRQADQRDRQRHLATALDRLAQSEQAMLRASAALAQAYVDKESAERQLTQLQRSAEQLRLERQKYIEQTQAARQEWQSLQEQVHAHELQASDLQHRLENLAVRLREDHDLDLAALYRDYQPPETPIDQPAIQEEIAELKRKITRLGSVSLDAIQELEALEARAGTLRAQHDDLAAAKQALDEIIAKINQDSRRLFTETFQAVRGHFQELFRKVFGGGMADVILEDENDILESGIEIVARPPGKELRSISLMSGGEKTLTAVALLLAIFRSKPSPFCILDEVDAALDEANIGRFTAVLREFLDRSQFIIITHSKKTMAAADVLYGVTMQESGVSKRVAVRFEDWPDDGPPPADSSADAIDLSPPPADEAESAA